MKSKPKPAPVLDGTWREGKPGYCYHSAILRYRTETLLEKWRAGTLNPTQTAGAAWELAMRDPSLALREVRTRIADVGAASPKKKTPQALRTALHHVADVATARELAQDNDFNPRALQVTPLGALLDDLLEALPGMSPSEATAGLVRLGFLTGSAPEPLADGPRDAEAHTTSTARHEAKLLRFLTQAFASPACASLRPELAQHLRETCDERAYTFLLERWQAGEVTALDALAALTRLGEARVAALVGPAKVDQLVADVVRAIGGEPPRFESLAIDNASLPAHLGDLAPEHAGAIVGAIFGSPRSSGLRRSLGTALLQRGKDGARVLLDHAAHLPKPTLQQAALELSWREAHARVLAAGGDLRALRDHPEAPPDMARLGEAIELLALDVPSAVSALKELAADVRHPDREAAFQKLVALVRGEGGDRARRFAIHRIGELGDARALPALEEAHADPALADAPHLVTTAMILVRGRAAMLRL